MSRLLVALVAGRFATAGIAQTASAPVTAAKDAKPATAMKSRQDQVESATADKGCTQRAADQAAQ